MGSAAYCNIVTYGSSRYALTPHGYARIYLETGWCPYWAPLSIAEAQSGGRTWPVLFSQLSPAPPDISGSCGTFQCWNHMKNTLWQRAGASAAIATRHTGS